MGSRSGDLDPGILAFLARTEQMSVDAFQSMVNHESGLLGISETSSDMRELLALESRDERAADAVEMFCYQTRKWIAAMAAALGGVDVLVFAGGIGEGAPLIRERICAPLGFLGLGVDAARNDRGEPIISPDEADVRVRVIRTDEELMIARSVQRILDGDTS
jgi:acetate kinase